MLDQHPTTIDFGELDAQDIWQRACADLEHKLSPAVYNTWILSNPLTQIRPLSDTQLVGVITSPTVFHLNSVKKSLQSEIKNSLKKVIGIEVDLEFEVGSPTPPKPPTKAKSTFAPAVTPFSTTPSSTPSSANKIESPRVEDLFSPTNIAHNTVSQAGFAAKKAGLRTDYTFKTFAVSTTNEMAHAAATAVSQNPGTAYNPLFFYGGVGVGKTHLMHAIGNNIVLENPQAKIIYCTGEEFTNDIVSSIQQKKTLQFKNKYRGANVLLIDDVQFIAGKNAVQEEFFHTFNAIIQQQGQIVMTSDRPPHEINLLEDRLRSRFEAGLMIDIQQPTFELRTAILLIKSKAHQVDIPMDIAQLIASKVDSARKIEGIITSLRSEIELKGNQISKDLVEKLLKTENKELQQKLRVAPNEIIRAVANHYHVKQIVIRGKKRQKAIVQARHVAMYLLKEELDMPYTEIGRWFSNRDHTSALHAYNKIGEILQTDETLRRDISALKMNLAAISK